MNRKQTIVLFLGIAGLVEWYFATKNVDYPLWVLVAVGAAVVAIMCGLFYIFRDKEESEEDDGSRE